MKKQKQESIKLGLFVMSGLVLLIFSLYLLGQNKGIFGSSFELKTRFKAVNGLVPGNNVRFAGIDIGAVKKVEILNDTVIEVTINVENKMRKIIRNNAIANLGTDGLIGNRVINIFPKPGNAPFAMPGDLLPSKEEISTDMMLQTLHQTNENVAAISEELRITVHRIQNSAQLTQLLEDGAMMANLKASLANLNLATGKASSLMSDAINTISLASKGNGALATLLTDTSMASEIQNAVQKIKTVEAGAERLANDLSKMVVSLDQEINNGKGTVNVLMKDTLMASQLRTTMQSVEKGTAAFNENMEALKHNILFRRYFKKKEKEKQKELNHTSQNLH